MPTLTADNSYVTYAEFQAYCDLIGRTAPAQDVVEPRLIQGTLALDRKYGARFLGRKTDSTQPLQWPRTPSQDRMVNNTDGLYTVDAEGNYRDLNTIPPEVQEAVCEVALAMPTGFTLYSQDNPAVTEETKKVDVLSTTYKYAGPFAVRSATDYTIDLILFPILLSSATKVVFTA